MNDLLYGRGLTLLLALLLLSVVYVYTRALRRYRETRLVRIAAAGIAIPTMVVLVVFQIYLFRMVTGVTRPLQADTVFFATMCGEGLAMAAILILHTRKVRGVTSAE